MVVFAPLPVPPPFFFFNDTATTEIYTLSLHDALPISSLITPSPSGLPPAAKLHTPVPITGTVPFRFALVPHSVWLVPTKTRVISSHRFCTSSLLSLHTPLLIVQRKI